MRVLPCKRISRDTEDSSALERQSVELSDAIHSGNHEIAGWVEDATVSGSVNLDQRPSLGKWLAEPLLHEWDALMVTTQDRISRDDLHWWAFVAWVLENGKTVLVLDDPSLDLTTEDGRMIAGIKATQAAKYRRTVQEKKRKQTEYYRTQDLWPGGVWPYGYRAERVEHNGAKRWKLVIDPYASGMVREAYDRLVNQGDSLMGIARDWNKRGVLCPIDYQRHCNALAGREGVKTETAGTKWTHTNLRNALSKPALMGIPTTSGEIRLRDGLPVRWAEPVLTDEEFRKLQAALAAKRSALTKPKGSSPAMLGVVFCRCGRPMYSDRTTKPASGKVYEYYKCASKKIPGAECPDLVSWPQDLVHAVLEDLFLAECGGVEVIRRTFVPGVDHSAEIATLTRALDNLAQSIASAESPAVIAALSRTMEQHARSLALLESEPVVPSRYETEGTGETYRELWQRLDGWPARGRFLHKAGVRLFCGGAPSAPELYLFTEHLIGRAQDVAAGTVSVGFPEDSDTAAQARMAELQQRRTQ